MAGDFDLMAALNAAPSLYQSPSLAVASTADPTDVAGTAQTVGAATEYNAAAQAIQKVKTSHGFFGGLYKMAGAAASAIGDIPGVKDVASTAADLMNKGVQNAQHEYRYLHEIQAQHGWGAALGELGIMSAGGVAGGVAGFFAAGPVGVVAGAVAGSEGAGYISHYIPAFEESWKATADGNKYRDNNGQPVSFGRDATSLIPWLSDPTTRRHSIASGLLDGIFDVATDPTLKLGTVAKGAKAVDLTAEASPSALRLQLASKITMKDAQSFDIAMQNRRVAAAVQKIADTNDASSMRRLLPGATDDEVAQLTQAQTVDDVRQVYQNSLHTSNILNRAPVVSLLSPISARLRTAGIKDAEQSYGTGQDIANGTDVADLASPENGRIERFQRRFLTRLPLDSDPLNSNPTRSFHLNGPNAGDVVHGIVSYSFDSKVADAVRDAFIDTPDITKKAVIYGNAIKAAAWNMGFKDADPQLWKQYTSEVDNQIERVKGYGVNEDGTLNEGRISTPARSNGASATTGAAIMSSQVGRAAIPAFSEMRKALADAKMITEADGQFGKAGAILGPKTDSGARFLADDFLYRHLTQPIFKRLSLFSGGFALRIGLGEGLFQALDEGVATYLRSQIISVAAKQAFKLSTGERNNLLSSVIAAGGMKLAPAEMENAIRLQMEHTGYILPHELDANHIQADSLEAKPDTYSHNIKKMATNNQPSHLSDEFRTYDANHQYFDFFYRKHLEDMVNSPEMRTLASTYKDALDSPSANGAEFDAVNAHAAYLQSKVGKAVTANMDRSTDYALQNNGGYVGFAGEQFKALKGALTGMNGEFNRDLLDKIAQGQKPSLSDLEALDRDAKPGLVPGQEVSPNVDSSIARIFNAGHVKVIAPVINALSRNGTFIRKVTEEHEIALNSGLPADEAWRIAQQRAAFKMAPDIHNPNIRTQFSELARNFMPFYFAQDQAYRRWGRLAVRSPESLRKLQLIHQAGVNSGVVHKDPSTGEETFMYPGSGYIGAGLGSVLSHVGINTLSGVPLSFSGNVSSLSSVTPFAESPGLRAGGPVVGIPMAALESFAPESAPFVESVKGQKGSGSTVWDMLLPNAFLKNVLLAYNGEHSRGFQSAQMQALQSVFYEKLNSMTPDEVAAFNSDPNIKQELLEKSKNYARTLFLAKAVLGEGLPTQPSWNIGDTGMKQEFADLLRTQPTVGDAIAAFQRKHPGEDLTPFSVFQSKSVAGGYIPPTQAALDYFEQNKQLLTHLPYGSAWLIPQQGGASADAAKVYNEQVATGLRRKLAPDEFVTNLFVAAGNATYYAAKDAKDAALAKYANDPLAKQQISDQWQKFVSVHSKQNYIWASQQGDKTRAVARERALQDFKVLFDPANADHVPQNEQFNLVRDLYAQYRNYDTMRATITNQPGRSSIESDQAKALDQQWQDYLTSTANVVPALGPVIQGVFKEVK